MTKSGPTADKKLSPIFHDLILSFVLRENYLDYHYNYVNKINTTIVMAPITHFCFTIRLINYCLKIPVVIVVLAPKNAFRYPIEIFSLLLIVKA